MVGGLTQASSVFVVLTSFILRTIFIKLISCFRENKNSKQALGTMTSILSVTFFNQGILYIIAPWNFVEYGADGESFFTGLYTDFTSQWFVDIGPLVSQTAFLNIIFPILEFLCFWGIRHVFRMID